MGLGVESIAGVLGNSRFCQGGICENPGREGGNEIGGQANTGSSELLQPKSDSQEKLLAIHPVKDQPKKRQDRRAVNEWFQRGPCEGEELLP